MLIEPRDCRLRQNLARGPLQLNSSSAAGREPPHKGSRPAVCAFPAVENERVTRVPLRDSFNSGLRLSQTQIVFSSAARLRPLRFASRIADQHDASASRTSSIGNLSLWPWARITFTSKTRANAFRLSARPAGLRFANFIGWPTSWRKQTSGCTSRTIGRN